MQKYPTHKSELGFTLIELLIVIAIIGILAGIGIPQYTQYKIRAYDAHSKQALKDIHLLCNAYWLDTDSTQGCDLPKIKETTYGFNQNADVVATLPPSPLDNFCASAQHNSSPNTYSIDSASLISSGSDCSGAGGSVQTASAGGSVQTASVSPEHTFEGYKPPEEACSRKGAWVAVDSDGKSVSHLHRPTPEYGSDGYMDAGLEQVEFQVGTCARFGPGGSIYADDGLIHFPRPNNYKMVYALSARHPSYSNVNGLQAGRLGCVGVERKFSCSEGRGALVNKYNFETGIWSNDQGEKYKNGNRVE